MADTLVRFAATLTSDLGEDGGECLMELAVEAQNEASSCAEREARRRAELGAATRGSDDEPDACHAVVRVDHMNDSKGYVRTLQKWCANLGLDGGVLERTERRPDRRFRCHVSTAKILDERGRGR